MSEDLIKRSDAIKALNREKSDWNCDYNVPINNCIKRLNKVKSVDRPQGKWKALGGTNWHGISFGAECSNCKACYDGIILSDYSFCPNCGARMKGADDERG